MDSQLLQENTNIADHVRGLGQKYMGIRPETHAKEMFKELSYHAESGHPVAVDNFLNAQCKPTAPLIALWCKANLMLPLRLFRDCHWKPAARVQGRT